MFCYCLSRGMNGCARINNTAKCRVFYSASHPEGWAPPPPCGFPSPLGRNTTPHVIPAYRAPRNCKISWVISAGIQLTTFVVNLCHSALLHRFAFANWIPRVRGMTTKPSACCRHINELDPDGRFYVLCRWQRCKNSLRMTTRRPRLWVAGKKHARFVASSRLSSFRHPGVSGPAKLQNFVGDFGRDPVDALRQPVSFGIITQVCFRKLDTALRRYDDKAVGVLPTHKWTGS